MNSRESPGIVAGQIAVVGVRMLDIAIEKGVAAGVKAATDRIEEERKKERKGRYDRRLHNTRLLLKLPGIEAPRPRRCPHRGAGQ